jgi:hypothetical protein
VILSSYSDVAIGDEGAAVIVYIVGQVNMYFL